MVTQTISTLGFDLNTQVPGSVVEYDTLAKQQGACLTSAVLNVLYRSTLATFRSNFVEAVENNTGIERKMVPVLNKDGTPKVEKEVTKNADGTETTIETPVTKYAETEKDYFSRVCAQLVTDSKFASLEAAAGSFQALAQTTIDTITFDPSETEKTQSGPKKIAKAYTALAQKASDNGKLETLAATLATKLVNWTVLPTVDSVARAISEDQRRKRENEKLDQEYAV